MPQYLVYKQGERPWPDEVRWLSESEMYEAVQDAAGIFFRSMTPNELAEFARKHLGFDVDVRI